MIINKFLFGFSLGLITVLITYKIIYHIFWYNFKRIGKKYNLLTIRCKKCNNYFYIHKFETTKLCCNCICLEND